MKRVVFLLALLCFFYQAYGRCFQIVRDDGRDAKSLCSIDGFTLANPEHIVVELEKPFIVRKISGRVYLEDGQPMPEVLLEIRGKDTNWKSQKIHKVFTNENGFFSFKHIKYGIYCFKVTLDGFQSVMGEIIVSKKAKKNSSVVIEMNPGV